MLQADFHTHSNYSNCGMHTVMEIIYHARDIGLKMVAITDHGSTSGGKLCGQFFDRFSNPVKEVILLKGIECNIHEDASLDMPKHISPGAIDIVLFGLHMVVPTGRGVDYYTDLVIKTMEQNTRIDILTHPDHKDYPLDFERLATVAQTHGIALELNNACTMLKKTKPETTLNMLAACKKAGCRIAINSDAHTLNELGRDYAVLDYLKRTDFPDDLIVNSTVEKAIRFIEEREKGII